MNVIEEIENEQIEKLSRGKDIPDFAPGDTLRVQVKVVEGSRERIQVFQGVCIARKNAGLNSSFTVRKLSYGEGVERVFPLYSPRLGKIEVVRKGRVRRAKLYYLRGRTGKRARIAEKTGFASARPAVTTAVEMAKPPEQAVEGLALQAKDGAEGEPGGKENNKAGGKESNKD